MVAGGRTHKYMYMKRHEIMDKQLEVQDMAKKIREAGSRNKNKDEQGQWI